jgi:hypothetical protein
LRMRHYWILSLEGEGNLCRTGRGRGGF